MAICASDSDTYVRARLANASATAAKTPVGRTYVTHCDVVSRVLSFHAPEPHERPRDDRSEERTERRDEDRGSGVDHEVLVGEHQDADRAT